MHVKTLFVVVSDPNELNTPASAADIAATGASVGGEGTPGPQGEIGPMGPAGADGAPGANGQDGAQGPIGLTGPQGEIGPQGPQGLPGNDGADGADGATGPQGPAGNDGAPGADGADGAVPPFAISDTTGLQTALDGKAATSHNHDAAYAAIGHNHTGVYAAVAHNHDASYAAIGHNHDAAYLAINHASVTNARKPAYVTGDGGAVTQATSKTTGVTLNKLCGQITMNGAALAAAAEVTFTVTNSLVASTDVVVACVQSVGTAGAYLVTVGAVANGSFAITVGNASAGSLSQALVLNYVVIKAVAS